MKKPESIWDVVSFDDKSPNILKTLREQAEKLGDKTNGLLYAEVNPIDAYDERSFELGIVYNFYVYAPFLGNYRNLLFTVVERGGSKNEILLINRIAQNKPVNIKDPDSTLIQEIERIIDSSEVKELLINLYGSSIEAKK